MIDADEAPAKVIAVVTCDFDRSAIGTRSRLRDAIGGKAVLSHVLERLLAVGEGGGMSDIVLLVPAGQMDFAEPFVTDARIQIMELIPRSAAIECAHSYWAGVESSGVARGGGAVHLLR